MSLNTVGCTFSPIIDLPSDYEVYDFSEHYDEERTLTSPFGIGKYNELRPDMYSGELFDEDQRNIHIGIDIGAPEGTPVKSFFDGEIFLFADNNKPYDYGPTLITKHTINKQTVFALYGHLSRSSLEGKHSGQKIKAGEVIAWVGTKEENGGWNSHTHFQLCLEEPKIADLPGVVSAKDREQALKTYPDPRLVLGNLY